MLPFYRVLKVHCIVISFVLSFYFEIISAFEKYLLFRAEKATNNGDQAYKSICRLNLYTILTCLSKKMLTAK